MEEAEATDMAADVAAMFRQEEIEAAADEAAVSSHKEIVEEAVLGEDSSSDEEETEEGKGSAEEVAKGTKKSRKVDFNGEKIKAARSDDHDKGGAADEDESDED